MFALQYTDAKRVREQTIIEGMKHRHILHQSARNPLLMFFAHYGCAILAAGGLFENSGYGPSRADVSRRLYLKLNRLVLP